MLSLQASQRTVDTVYGFMKEAQSLLPNENNPYYNIPELVVSVCLNFYNNPEYFTSFTDINDKEQKTYAKYHEVSSTGYQTHYGAVNITNEVNYEYIWTLELLKNNGLIAIGIDSSNKGYNKLDFHDCENMYKYYAIEFVGTHTGELYSHTQEYTHEGYSRNSLEAGDIIEMRLNMKDRTLQYYINSKHQKIYFSDIQFDKDTVYNLAVCIDRADIELKKFEQFKQP